jgi:hypothetical protein
LPSYNRKLSAGGGPGAISRHASTRWFTFSATVAARPEFAVCSTNEDTRWGAPLLPKCSANTTMPKFNMFF